MKIIFRIQEDILNLIYPPICGICGKLDKNLLCKKCELQLKKMQKNKIIAEGNDVNNKYFNEIIYIFKYEGIIRKTLIDYKFKEKSYLYKTFVNFLLKNKKIFEKIQKYDKIIPVPISKQRYKERGYNQCLLIAKEIAQNTRLELVNNCLYKSQNIIQQSKLNKEDRYTNIQGAFEVHNKLLIKKQKILLLDDIYTTGSTVNECSKVLKEAEPIEIGVLVLAKD